MISARPAPMADRTAISRSRASPRTNSRLATLSQVMSSRRQAARVNATTAVPTSPRMSRGKEVVTPLRVTKMGSEHGEEITGHECQPQLSNSITFAKRGGPGTLIDVQRDSVQAPAFPRKLPGVLEC